MRSWTTPLDLALGSLLAVAAFGFGVVGFIAGLLSDAVSVTWFVAAVILAVLAGGVLLDEASARARDATRRLGAWLGTLLLLGALAMGVVGFVLGLRANTHAMTWLISSLVLAVLSLAATVDEMQSWRALRTGMMNTLFGLGFVSGLLGLGLGVVGFILGVMSRAHSTTWLWAAVISSVVAVAWNFEAEHYAVLAEHPEAAPSISSRFGSGTAA